MFAGVEKNRSLKDLSLICERLRNGGNTIVLAHGTFDLLHLGHVRHLREARSHGDVLVVTLTADAFVNKGPGRPVFSDALRAEMLASLSFVDYVAVNNSETAISVIDSVKPNYYVKGSDYRNADEDVTGKIVDERLAVERHGGSLIFTDNITFSSSSLINNHLEMHEPDVAESSARIRETTGLQGLIGLIEEAAEMRVLIVGDTILDEYHFVHPSGQPSKENIIATRYEKSEIFAGGVIATANHLASYCKSVDIVTCIGTRDPQENFVKSMLQDNINLMPIYRDDGPTTRKVRYVEMNYVRKLFEVQHIEDSPLPEKTRSGLNDLLTRISRDYDVVLVNDFGHGLIMGDTIRVLNHLDAFVALNVQTNSANRGYNLVTKYTHADYVCIDAPEARLAVGDRFGDLSDTVVRELAERLRCGRMILTHGRHGCVTFEDGHGSIRIPAVTQTVVDTMGAGDAFFAVTSVLARAGGRMSDVGFVGNMVGALKVNIVGHRKAVDKISLIKAITAWLK